MKARVDRDECVGVGNCVALAPEIFSLDDQNKAVVAEGVSAGDQTLWDAAQSCPVNAVILQDDEGRQVYP